MTTTINFNDLSAGTVVDNEYSSQGVTVSATGGSGEAMIFDTANPTGNDHDLATSNLGNVLIISEDGDSHDPDDNSSGGTFHFAFDTGATVKTLTFLDIEETASITLYAADGSVIDTIHVGATGNNGQVVATIDVAGVASMDVKLEGSGAIDDLVFDAGPAASGPDYIVEGTSTGELIDTGYTGDPEGDMIDALDDGGSPASNDDVVEAGGGDDTVKAGDGDDTVYAGTGNDFVLGDDDNSQAGDDLLMGEEGDDTLCGLDGDDTLDGGAGDDLLEGMDGDDLILGGSGDDRGFGDAGNDTIFGDQGGQDGGASVREVFQWDLSPSSGASDFSQDTGNVTVTFSEQNGGASDNISTDAQNVADIDTGTLGPVDGTSSLDSETGGQGNSDTYSLDFSDPVENVSFRVNDIDGDGVVRIQAFDENGDPIEVVLDGGSNLTLLDTDGVSGNDTADSNGGYLPDTSSEYSVLVTIPGPVSSITILHTQDGSNNSGINVTDVYFDVPNVGAPEGDGNDTLFGGEGDDLIYGNGGDDSIRGDAGDDTLYGDDPDEGSVVSGNLIFNGSFEITSGMTTTGFGFRADDGEAPGWTDANGEEIDFHNDGRGGVNPTDGQNWLDLEASPGNARVGQDVDGVQDGETYRLTFDAGDKADEPQSGAGENLIEVYWGGELIAVVDPEAGQMDQYTFEVVGGAGDGSDRLEFVGTGDLDNFGASVDNVSLVQLAGAPGDGGDDTMKGGEGADEIFGQGGDDSLEGGSGNDAITGGDGADTMSGGDDRDTFVGGNDGDVVDGGTGSTAAGDVDDVDTLDLTGEGPFRVINETDDADGNSTSGTIEFLDGAGDPTGATLTFTEIEVITGDRVNDDPTAMDDSGSGEEDTDITGNVLINDSDPNLGDSLEVVGNTDPSHGTVTVEANGDYTYKPADDYFGPDSFEYTVSDGNGGTATATVNLTVTPINDDPDAVDDSNTTDFETATTINVLANDSDIDNPDSDLTVTAISVPAAQGTLAPTGTEGEYTFTPADGFEGTATVSYTISDGAGGSDSATHTIEVGADPTPQDGIVDGEESGELMELGYDDANLPTDNGGDIITNDADVIEGNGGDDTIDGAGGDDTIDGGTGDDVIAGGDGTNVLSGGAGDDTFVGGDGADSFQGNNGQDNLDYSGSDDAVNVDLSTGTLSGGDADNDSIVGGIDGVIGSEFDDTLTGFDQSGATPDDTFTNELFGEGGNDTISGLGGDDLLDGGADDDVVSGGDGDDMITGGTGNDDLSGDAGDDTVDGGDGSDTIAGGEGADSLTGGNDDDDIVVGAGDTAEGQSGDDVFTVDPSLTGTDDIIIIGGETGEDLTDPTNGEEGDVLDLRGLDLVSLVFNPTDPEAGTAVYNNDGGDPVTIIFSEIETVLHDPLPDGAVDGEEDGEDMGPNYDDGLQATDNGGDLIDGADGLDDTIFGNGGDDTINAGLGSDTVSGGTGNDEIFGGATNDGDLLSGDEGDDTLQGGGGDDTLDGGADDDRIEGGTGNDDIDGGTGNDDIEGGSGEDTIDGGEGNDTINAGADDDTVDGGDGDDSIVGGNGNDDLTGGDGDDTVKGGAGDDSVTGGAGDDVLEAGAGNDTVEGGAGDTITGGEGADSIRIDQDEVDSAGENATGIEVDGGTTGDDNDTLDLTDYVAHRNLVETVDADGDSTSGTVEVLNDEDEWVPVTFSEIENLLLPPASADGVVDGEEFGEDMQPGYNDADGPTDGGGDQIDGSDGDDDVIEGNGGDDTINAGQGSDTVSGGTGDDSIIGGASDDGDDLSGDEGDDTIQGGGGDDTIDGGTGDDSIEGGTGDDTIIGGDGNDDVVGGEGNDVIDTSGTAPATDLATPNIPPFITGGPGDVDPDDDKDTVDGGAGDDTITTGDDADVIFGGTGNDVIDGGIDADTIDGGADNDSIVGGEGSDSIMGGGGNDTIYGGLDSTAPDVLNVADDGFNSPIGPDPVDNNGDDYIDGGAGDDLIFGQDDNDTILGGTGNDTIDGGVDDDSILGGQGEDVIEGGHGQDFIQGNNDNDLISGGRGSDTLEGNAGDDTIIGGAGDSIIGGGGADSIFIDQDEVDENGDNDTAIFVEGNTFGDDNDTLDLTDFVAYRNLVETPDGDGDSTSGSVEVQNDEDEWVEVTFGEIENLLLPPMAPDMVVDGEEFGELMDPLYDDADGPTDGGGDIIDGPDGDDDSIRGNGGDDTINAGAGNDTVDGGADNDTVNGQTGNDIVDGGDGDDLVTGGFGNDTVLGGDGDDTLRGNQGNDSLDGGDGNDSMGGAEGDDTLTGGAGEDTLTGGSGNDVLDGGLDDDTITGSSGNDTITDLDGDNLITSGPVGLPDLGVPFVPGTFDEDADPNDDRDSITTGAGNDTINSGDDADTIDAGDGDNVIDGGFDADVITSGAGNDSIVGGEGSDTINSGDGDDTIQGGINSDAANLIDDNVNPANNDDILDNGDDLINAGAGNDVVFGEDDNDTIDGGEGDDTLDGGIDDDVITGGEGNDVIVGGQGADSLDGGTGDDVFNVGTFTDPVFGDDYQEGVGDTIVGGEDVGDGDIDTLDLTGGGSLKVVFDDAVDPTGTPGESGTVIYYTDATQTTESGRLEFKEIENVIPCFTPGAMIATPRGEVPVETLREGDKVITRDNGIQEIRWTGNRTLNRAELAEGDGLKPILIKAGSLGRNLPERDMLVSPQHRVLITGETPQLYFEESEVLVAAKHLVGTSGVSIMDTMRTTYIHFMFDRHEVVLSDGAWTESFQPGDQTLGAMGAETRDEIIALFPELATKGGLNDYAAARRSLKAHEAKLLRL